MLDMTLSMESVNSLHPTLLLLLILDVRPGKLEFVPLVLQDGSSTTTMSVLQLTISVKLMTMLVPVLNVTLDTTLSMVLANSLPQTMLLPLTLDVTPGIMEFVRLVLKTGSLMPTESVFLSMLTVELTTQTDSVPDAGRDMIMLMEDASSLLQTTKDQLCKDVRSGTGTLKPVLNAQLGGSSTLTESVLKSQLFVPLMMPMELVLDVIVDIISTTEFVNSLLVNQSLMLDATLGKLESALLVLKTGSSTQMVSAELFLINVRLTTSVMDGVLHVIKDTT